MQTYDVVIIGAGPVGLFQVFELGLLGLNAAVVDSLPYAGGQCRELYADKPIYDIPGVVQLSGRQLIDNLLQQIQPFAPAFYLGEQVHGWQRQGDAFVVHTDKGTQLRASALVIAAGVGMFRYVPVKIDGIARFEGQSLHYAVVDAERFRNRHVVILGGGNTALQEAIDLHTVAASVTHVHKTSRLRADADVVTAFQALCDQQKIRSLTAQATGFTEQNAVLNALIVTDNNGIEQLLPCDDVLALFGQSPDVSVMAPWPVQRDHQQIAVDTASFATSEPGVYAVGDINHYNGKRKLILSGFHEATLAAFAIAQQLQPDKKVHLQYTTTSPLLHQRLGKNPEK